MFPMYSQITQKFTYTYTQIHTYTQHREILGLEQKLTLHSISLWGEARALCEIWDFGEYMNEKDVGVGKPIS